MHNLTMIDGKGLLAQDGDRKVWLTGARMFARKEPWHALGNVNADGYYGEDGLNLIDPNKEMRMRLVPSGYVWNGRMIPDGFANVISHVNAAEPIVYGKVKCGKMTPAEWRGMNPDRPDMPTRSKLYEIISPEQIIEILDEVVRDQSGKKMKAESMGFLGENGEDGLFVTYRLNDWDKSVVAEIQTEVREHLIVYASWDGTMYAYNSETVVVCWNTLMSSLRSAKRILKVDHQLGAYGRMKTAATGIFEAAIEGRRLMQEAALWLLNKPVTEDDVMYVAERVYRDPGAVDEQLIGVRSLEARQRDYNNRLSRQGMVRQSIVKLWKDEAWHPIAGITPNMKGSALAAWQAFTFHSSYSPSDSNASMLKQLVSGYRRGAITASFDELMTITGAPDTFERTPDEAVKA